MTIVEKQRAMVERFEAIPDWEERYREIIAQGRALAAFPEEQRLEKNKVKGCQSQVWMHAWHENGRAFFAADSDATIVKGLIALVLEAYSGQTFDDVIATPATFVDGLGLGQNLSQSRANGLSAMLKQVKLYGFSVQSAVGSKNFMKMMEDFKSFALKGNVVDLAVGVIIGAAFGKIVTSFVSDLLMPPLGLALGEVDFSDYFWVLRGEHFLTLKQARDAGAVTLNYGVFLNNCLQFVIQALATFLLVTWMHRLHKAAPAPAAKPQQEVLLEEIRDILKSQK